MYLFLWLPAERSKCARGHILLLLIAFRLNEKEFLSYCLLFMKWKEITSCIISLYGWIFIFFFKHCYSADLKQVQRVGAVIHRTYILLYIGVRWEGGEEGEERKGEKPPPRRGAAALNTVWFLSLWSFSSATKPRLQVQCSLIAPVSTETACPSSPSSPAKSFWVVNVSSWSYF